MNKKSGLYILLGLLIGSGFLAACGIDFSVNTGADETASSAAGIADFDPPSGYSLEFTTSLDDYTLVSYTPGDGHSHLYLVQSQAAADANKLEQAMRDIIPGKRDPKTRLTILETRPVTVRGQETKLVISEGVNGDGESYRQAMVAFTGNGGPALLVYSTTLAIWDIATVETLLASIR